MARSQAYFSRKSENTGVYPTEKVAFYVAVKIFGEVLQLKEVLQLRAKKIVEDGTRTRVLGPPVMRSFLGSFLEPVLGV